jgi:hypothetical protein
VFSEFQPCTAALWRTVIRERGLTRLTDRPERPGFCEEHSQEECRARRF